MLMGMISVWQLFGHKPSFGEIEILPDDGTRGKDKGAWIYVPNFMTIHI